MFRKSVFLFSVFNPRSQAAVMIAFIATSTGRISAGNSGLQCIDRTTPETFVWIKIELNDFLKKTSYLPRAAPTISPVGPFIPSTHPG